MEAPIFVFGISGATWQVLDPLIAAGRLPTFARLQAQGCRADLLSARVEGDKHYRPQVAWASLATGCDAERHGVTRFYHSADDLKVPSLWERFSTHGKSVGVYGWPLDWPPRPVRGFIVPSHLARDSRTWPADLSPLKALDREQQNSERAGGSGANSPAKYLNVALGLRRNGVRLGTFVNLASTLARAKLLANAEGRSLLLRRAKLDMSADVFLGLCQRFRPELCTFHTFFVDFVSHRFWRYHEPERFADNDWTATARFRSAVTDAYIHTDRILGRMLGKLSRRTRVIVMSEHGMQAEPVSGEVGRWRYVIDAAKLSELVGLQGQLLGSPVARWIAYRPYPSQAMPPDAIDRLSKVQVVETGLPLFQVHEHGANEVVVKFSLERSVPRYQQGDLESLTLRFEDRTVPFTHIARRLGRARSAMHDQRGMLLLAGPGIRQGERLADAQLVDIVPTVLRLAGLPVPNELDGRVLDVFATSRPVLRQVAVTG